MHKDVGAPEAFIRTRPEEILDPERQSRAWIWERVRENQVWYVACDATPHRKDGSLKPGAAYVIAPDGALVACTAPDNPGEAMVVHTVPVAVEGGARGNRD